MHYNTTRFGRVVSDAVVVFDMQHLTPLLNYSSVQFLRRMIHIDQHYYPETLHQLFIINAPVQLTYSLTHSLTHSHRQSHIHFSNVCVYMFDCVHACVCVCVCV
jgi:hypothetical protein